MRAICLGLRLKTGCNRYNSAPINLVKEDGATQKHNLREKKCGHTIWAHHRRKSPPRSNEVAGGASFGFITIAFLRRPISCFHIIVVCSTIRHRDFGFSNQTLRLGLRRGVHRLHVLELCNPLASNENSIHRLNDSTLQSSNPVAKNGKTASKNGSKTYQIDALMVIRYELSSSSYVSICFLLFFFGLLLLIAMLLFLLLCGLQTEERELQNEESPPFHCLQ